MKLDPFSSQGHNFLGDLSDKQKSKLSKMILHSVWKRFPSRIAPTLNCLTLEMLSSLVLPKGASITPAWPLGITTRTSVLSGRQGAGGGAHRILLKEKNGPGNDVTMTRPMQENIASKTLNFLGQRCPEDPALCVPMYSSAP